MAVLSTRVRVRLIWSVPMLAAALALGPAQAEDRLSLRGAYFREASTRVVQPMLEVRKDLPAGYEIGAQLMVDAISSASIGQGAATDEVFTENRYEGALTVGRTMDLLRVDLFGRLSREPDYHSMSAGLSLSREIWERTGTISLSAAYTHDDIKPPPLSMVSEKDLDVAFAGISYTQVLSPTVTAQASYEFFFQNGYIGNIYLRHPDYGAERLPTKRGRHALAFRIGTVLPEVTAGVQLSYRFYFDQAALTALSPWGMTAHTLEGRFFKNLHRDVELRLSYRFHWQGKSLFWCNSRPEFGGQISCFGQGARYTSWDVKFGNYTTHLPEVKVFWDMHGLQGVPLLRFLAHGTFDVSYGYYFESTPYGAKFTDQTAPPVLGELPFSRSHGGAHYVQTGYSLPF
jgi:hypothetical protein